VQGVDLDAARFQLLADGPIGEDHEEVTLQ